MKNGKIAKIDFCSIDDNGEKCAEWVEKETEAGIRGTLAGKKEFPKGKCVICDKPAKEVVYVGKSY